MNASMLFDDNLKLIEPQIIVYYPQLHISLSCFLRVEPILFLVIIFNEISFNLWVKIK